MKFHSLFLTALAALSLAMGGCSNDDIVANPDGEADGTKITFNIGVASVAGDTESRGTDGQYFDLGLAGENEVKDAVIIIYDRPINSKNGGGKILKSIYVKDLESFKPSSFPTDAEYFDTNSAFYPQSDVLNTISVGKVNLNDNYFYKKTVSLKPDKITSLEVGQRYYATAICNFGDITDDFAEDASLDVLRNYIYEGKLYEVKAPEYPIITEEDKDTKGKGIRGYTNFRMSGINETSFIWNSGKEMKLGDFMVQRLAARVDVMFGEPITDFINQETYFGDQQIKLAVYTYDENNVLGIHNKSLEFYLTDLEIVNNVEVVNNKDKIGENNQKSYMYLIERSSKVAPSGTQAKDAASVVYFDNEGWKSNTHREATKYVYSPADKQFTAAYSLHKVADYDRLSDLIKAGVFYNDENPDYFDNKKKSSIVGYLGENTNSESHTILRVKGRTNASTSNIFAGGSESRAISIPNDYSDVIGEIHILHNQNSACMRYGVVRNTVYRIKIKVVARDNKIFFEWYYVTPDGKSQEPYVATGFTPNVSDSQSGTTITPND